MEIEGVCLKTAEEIPHALLEEIRQSSSHFYDFSTFVYTATVHVGVFVYPALL